VRLFAKGFLQRGIGNGAHLEEDLSEPGDRIADATLVLLDAQGFAELFVREEAFLKEDLTEPFVFRTDDAIVSFCDESLHFAAESINLRAGYIPLVHESRRKGADGRVLQELLELLRAEPTLLDTDLGEEELRGGGHRGEK